MKGEGFHWEFIKNFQKLPSYPENAGNGPKAKSAAGIFKIPKL
jgi:hypothetical protein